MVSYHEPNFIEKFLWESVFFFFFFFFFFFKFESGFQIFAETDAKWKSVIWTAFWNGNFFVGIFCLNKFIFSVSIGSVIFITKFYREIDFLKGRLHAPPGHQRVGDTLVTYKVLTTSTTVEVPCMQKRKTHVTFPSFSFSILSAFFQFPKTIYIQQYTRTRWSRPMTKFKT